MNYCPVDLIGEHNMHPITRSCVLCGMPETVTHLSKHQFKDLISQELRRRELPLWAAFKKALNRPTGGNVYE